jgi:FkbM family methyltransferase
VTTSPARHVKAAIRRLFRSCGYDLVRLQKPSTLNSTLPEKPFNLLEIIVRDRISREPDFYFLQIGAYDGVTFDPLRPLVLQHHLRGLLVEPLPDRFASLRRHYASERQLAFANCAISAEDGQRMLYRFQVDAPIEDWMHLLASFDKQHLLKFPKAYDLHDPEHFIEEILAPTCTINTLLAAHRVDRVSLLQVDTEGYDFEILKMVFAAGIFPPIINYGHVHLALGDQIACRHLLAEQGYGFLSVGFDTLAVRG